MIDWILRFVKGLFIGSGFILPGVSGGALAAVFGIYERIISFLAHITKDFKKNVIYFIPVGLGGVVGIFLLSFVVSYFLGTYEVQILWFFVGCILGTIPALWKQAGKKGRKNKHINILVVSFFLSLAFLLFGEQMLSGGQVPQNIFTWAIAGALIGLGVIVPGLSPSNFLVYMGMYKDMADGVKNLDLAVILPIFIGVTACVLLLSKLMDYVFSRAYAGLFHAILGIVFASTIIIVPRNYNYLSFGVIVCILMCIAGAALGYWMSALEDKYKTADAD
jgi:putative membrane protein